MASLSRGLAPPFPPMSALQKADDPIDCLQMPEPRKKLVVDLEGDYARWRREHPPLDCEMSVNRWGSIFWLWTIIVSMAVSYNMISIPALVYIEDQETLAFWLYMNIVADVIYLLDIVVQSRLTFFSEGCEESSPIATILHYFHSKFASDVCSTVPIDLFVSYRSSFAFLRLNRLGKIGRVLELYQLAEKRWPAVVVSLSKLISLCALLFHWNACAYFYLGSFRNMNLTKGVNATFDDDVEWDWPYLPEKVTDLWTADCKLKCYGGMELVDEEREDAMMMLYQKWENRTIRWEFNPSLKEYVQSMYWSCLTITTLGEQPSPDDNTQTVFETADTLLGMVVFAAIMGSVGALVGNANRVEAERKTFMDGLKQFMSFRGVGEEMAQRVVRHCADELARGQRLHDGEVKDEVPERVFLAVNRQTALLPLALSPIFRGCGHSFLADIALKLISRRLGPGDVLAREGERHTEMYIVARGHLMLETDSETREVAEGCIVGEEGIIWLEEKPKSWKETVYSREYSQVFCLTREALFDVLEDFPHLIPILSERASRADEPILNSPRTTTEKLLSIAEDVAILGEHLDRQYEHFVAVSSRFKRRLHRLESSSP